MRKDDALNLLEGHKQEMVRQFGIRHLAVFGSIARDEAREDSDVDVLVEFEGGATFDKFMGLKIYLETLLETRIDLVTPSAIRPRMKPLIEKDLVYVA